MLLTLITSVSLALSPVPSTGGSCVDPATPLKQLAAEYASWPQPKDDRSRTAFESLQKYLRDGGSESEYRNVLRDYERIAEDLNADLHVKLALGILYATGSDLNPARDGGYRHRAMLHSALADDRASKTLGFVAEKDPAQWLPVIALTHIALATHEKGRVKQAVDLVGRALKRDPANATLRLAWSDLLISQNRAAEALTFLNANPVDCVPAQHVRAEALLITGDTAAGMKLYVSALQSAEPADLARFYDDARVVFSDGEADRYNATPVVERRAWLQLFWERSAALSGITVQSRVAQHMRRVQFADTHYRRAADREPGLQGGEVAEPVDPNATLAESERAYAQSITDRFAPTYTRLNDVPWDDRGVIYVRQGEPDTLFQTKAGSGTRIPRNETWVYDRATPPWVLTFANAVGPDYYWTFSIGCGQRGSMASMSRQGMGGRGRATATRASSGGGNLEARDFYNDLAQFDERFEELGKYCGLASVGGGSPLDFRGMLVKLNQYYRPLMRTITHTESAPPRFRKPLRMMIAAYSFRDARGRPEVTALTWIPTTELRDSVPVNRLRLTYTLVDSSSAPLRHDTTVAVPTITGSGLLRGATTWRDVSLNNGRLLVVATDDADVSRGTQRAKQIVIPVGRAATGISDLVVGDPDATGLLVRGDARISPLPEHAVTTGSEFRLFYELYGMTPGEDVATTVRVVRNERKSIAELLRLYPGRRDERELSISGPAKLDARGIVIQDVAVGGDLLPGEYTIEVRIKTAHGELVRSAPLRIDAPRR